VTVGVRSGPILHDRANRIAANEDSEGRHEPRHQVESLLGRGYEDAIAELGGETGDDLVLRFSSVEFGGDSVSLGTRVTAATLIERSAGAVSAKAGQFFGDVLYLGFGDFGLDGGGAQE